MSFRKNEISRNENVPCRKTVYISGFSPESSAIIIADVAGLLACVVCTLPVSVANSGFVHISRLWRDRFTATGIAPDLHRLPF